MLETISNSSRKGSNQNRNTPKVRGVTAKLDASTLLSEAPQLVILEKTYPMLAKPNPFSEQINLLNPGAGIYVISLQEGWYEVESADKVRGFIKVD